MDRFFTNIKEVTAFVCTNEDVAASFEHKLYLARSCNSYVERFAPCPWCSCFYLDTPDLKKYGCKSSCGNMIKRMKKFSRKSVETLKDLSFEIELDQSVIHRLLLKKS